MSSMKRHGFTLVELLVVVTIIVLLLSMLAPAMSKAIYQAQLVQCAARLRASTQAITDYAMNSKKFYPPRGLETKAPGTAGIELGPMQVYNINGYDVRPPLKGYITSVNLMLQCPLVEPVDLEVPPSDNPDLFLETSYMMFWGWQYRLKDDPNTYDGMYRMGDRWESPEEIVSAGKRRVSNYNLLMGDMDLRYGWTFAEASHPDRGPAAMFPMVWRSEFAFGHFWNLSRWTCPNGKVRRGVVDDNFAYDDNSVRRVESVVGWSRPFEATLDERMHTPLLQYDGGQTVGEDLYYVPAQ